MKIPIILISTYGKSEEQIKKETWEAWLKYQKTGEPSYQIESKDDSQNSK